MKNIHFNILDTPPKISQYFISLEGEGQYIGEPSIYIRLGGCFSAACRFCDTKFSWDADAPDFKDLYNSEFNIDLMNKIDGIDPRRMTITGGEPLHYISFIPEIFNNINTLAKNNLNFLGIESNGNLLSDKLNCLEVIKSFNEIDEFHEGVHSSLTLSPKIDAKACYNNKLTQLQINTMYFNVFENVKTYLKMFNVYYKFIYDFTNESVDYELTNIFLTYLIHELNIPKNQIMLMPLTPNDPIDKDLQFWNESKDATSRKALSLGIRYSPRIHIDRRLD